MLTPRSETTTKLCHSANRPEWLEARKSGIGASDLPKLLGLSSYGNALSLYVDKTRPELEEEEPPSPVADLGRELEAWLIARLAESYETEDWGLDGTLYRSVAHPHLLATRDAWLGREHVELKTTAFQDAWAGEVPPYVYAQVQQQAVVLGASEMLLGVVFRVNGERFVRGVPRDQEYIDDVILPATEAFWKRVVDRNPEGLEVDGSKWTTEALAKLNPEQRGTEKVLDSAFEDLADELVAIQDTKSELEKRRKKINNEIAAEIGTAARGVLPGGRYFNYRTTNVDEKTVKAYSFRSVKGPFGKG
jgi:predicted phage-related endonuclease